MGKLIDLQAADGTVLPAWTAQPDGPVRGAVVVAQEIFGVNAHIRAVTERFASRGFYAIAPALFSRVDTNVELGYDEESVQRGRALKALTEALPGEGVLQDIRAAAQWAQAKSGKKVGMVGFCWGGLVTWRAAERVTELSAAVAYYGGGITSALEVGRRPRCPVQTHFARQDTHIPLAEVVAFTQLQPDVQVHLYEADHGFNCDQRASYDQPSAIQAKDRTLAFLDQYLG